MLRLASWLRSRVSRVSPAQQAAQGKSSATDPEVPLGLLANSNLLLDRSDLVAAEQCYRSATPFAPGVPTLRLSGRSLLARQGASLLKAAALTDWIAANEDDFVERTSRLTGDVVGMDALRVVLRGIVATSPLFDGATFAQHLQAVFRSMRRT